MSWGSSWGSSSSSRSSGSGSRSSYGYGSYSRGPDNPNKDLVVKEPPPDTVSCLRFSPGERSERMFAISTWGSDLAVYEHDGKGNTRRLGAKRHDRPPLSLCWNTGGEELYSAGCDIAVRLWNLRRQHFQVLDSQHRAPVRVVQYSREMNAVITGSWDCSVAFFDLRSGQSERRVLTKKKVYCMSVKNRLLALGLHNKHVQWYDLRYLDRPIKDKVTNLKYMLRAMDCFPDGNGFAVASVEGRAAIEYCDPHKAKDYNFSFKCHRHPSRSSYDNRTQDVFGVNDLRFHQQFGTFATCGSDGEVNIWDKLGRSRLKHLERLKLPITSIDFNRTGRILAYATGYDWSKGCKSFQKDRQRPNIYLHQVKQIEVDPALTN